MLTCVVATIGQLSQSSLEHLCYRLVYIYISNGADILLLKMMRNAKGEMLVCRGKRFQRNVFLKIVEE